MADKQTILVIIQEFIQYIDIQMLSQEQLQQTYQVQESHYSTISQQITNYPKQQRKCTNTFCTSLLLATILFFFSIGIFYIVQYTYLQPAKVNQDTENSFQQDGKDINVLEHWQIIAIGVSISIFISFIYVLALNKLPKQIIFVGGLCVLGYFIDNLGLMLSMGIIFVLYVIFICYIKQKIGVGITMVKICGRFMNQKPIIFLLPIIKFVLIGGLTIFFIFTVSSISFVISHKANNNMSTTLQIILISLQLIIYIILIFLFYYMMCYTIGYICSNWYYNIKDKRATLLKCYKHMFVQIGSLMYGAMIIGLIIIVKIVMQIKRKNKKKENCVIDCCIGMVLCIFSRIQTFMQVLNHYTIIMISITGEDYINGAKTTIGLIYKQIQLMVIANLISNFLIVWSLILTVGIPTFTTFLFIAYKQTASPAQQNIIIGIVGICSVLISIIILVTIIQSISCIFIVYNLDKDMVQRKLIKNKRLQEETYYQIDRCSTNPYGNDNFDTIVQFGNYNYVRLQK